MKLEISVGLFYRCWNKMFRKIFTVYDITLYNIFCQITPINHLTPNGHFSGRTAPLTYRCCILYIYSTNIRTQYFNMLHTLRFFLFELSFIS
jgi:hypothetical protein